MSSKRFDVPTKFFEEVSQSMEKQMGGKDVFDKFRTKTVADREDDYHQRWRKRQLLPQAEDPFVAALGASKKKRKINEEQNTESTQPNTTMNSTQQQENRVASSIDALKDGLLETEKTNLIRETQLKLQTLSRRNYLKKKYENLLKGKDDGSIELIDAKDLLASKNNEDKKNFALSIEKEFLRKTIFGDQFRPNNPKKPIDPKDERAIFEEARRIRELNERERKAGEVLIIDGKIVKEKQCFTRSGLLKRFENVNERGIVSKWREPAEATFPFYSEFSTLSKNELIDKANSGIQFEKWRLFVFKGNEQIESLKLFLEENDVRMINKEVSEAQKKSFMFGKDKRIVDFVTLHPSCSRQHAVICFRKVLQFSNEEEKKMYEKFGKVEHGENLSFTLMLNQQLNKQFVVKPYLIDLNSGNGTYLNKEKIDSSKFYELRSGDLINFGKSTRDYVIMKDK